MKTQSSKRYIQAIIMAIITVAFTVAIRVCDVQAIGPKDSTVGLATINGAFHNLTGYIPAFYTISEVLGYVALLVAAAFAVIGFLQLWNKKSLRKVDPEIIALGVLYVVVLILYVAFDKIALNYRPVILDPKEGLEASYPSSHTMLSISILGSGILAIRRILDEDQLGRIIQWVFGVLMVLIILCRTLSGVHWLTDIIGSILICSTLLLLYSGALAQLRERRGYLGA